MTLSALFNCCRPKDYLDEPDFISDLQPDEAPTQPLGYCESLGGRIVSTFYTAGAKYVVKKDFEAAREDFKEMIGYELKTIRTWDNVNLDTGYIPGTVKKAVILVPGLGDRFESLLIKGSLLEHIEKVIKEQLGNVTILSPNARGFGHSEGVFAPKRLYLDIYAAHQYLVDKQGFEPEDIFIFGESLGGCSGLRAAGLVQKTYPYHPISAISDRSFLRLEDVVEARTNHCRSLALKTMRCIEFDADCEEGAKSLKGTILAIGAENDQVVPLKSFFGRQQETAELKDLSVLYIKGDDSSPEPHTRYWLQEEQETIGSILRKMVFGEIKNEEVADAPVQGENVVIEKEPVEEEKPQNNSSLPTTDESGSIVLVEVKKEPEEPVATPNKTRKPRQKKVYLIKRESIPREAKNIQAKNRLTISVD